MPTIAVLSDAPTLTTGFGRTTARIAAALGAANLRPVCFGLKASADDVRQSSHPVWPAERGGHWTDSLAEFFAVTGADLLVLNMDAFNAVEVIAAVSAAGWRGPVLSYVVFDGLPVEQRYLDAQRSCTAVLASSHTAAAYLRDNRVPVVGVAPPGVDVAEFAPHPDRSVPRSLAGVRDAVVIGVFGTNTERKQLARVIAALPAISGGLAAAPVLYLHCRPDGYWPLVPLAAELGVGAMLAFPVPARFDERRGVPTTTVPAPSIQLDAVAGGTWPAALSYVDRINCCDVIVNVPHSGDIEQVILEAQACGVPLVHTDDGAVMAEAVGNGGVLLRSENVGRGRAGELVHYVSSNDIAQAVLSVLNDTGRHRHLQAAGRANARRYPWDVLQSEICRAVEHCLGS